MSTHSTTNSGPRTVRHALLVPITVLAVMVLFIGLVASLLLFNTKNGAVALAAMAAAGILLAVSLLTSRDGLDRGRKAVVVGAGVLPLVVGVLVATDVIGGIDDADRMWNVQPLTVIPDDVPLIAAENSNEFCFIETLDGPCTPGDRWEVVPSTADETLSFVFDNREAGIVHNVVITELAGTEDAPEAGDMVLTSDVINGPSQDYHVEDTLTWGDLPEQWYFFCAIHPLMNGVGTVVEG